MNHQIAIPGSSRVAVPGAKLISKSDGASKISVSIYARRNPRPSPGVLARLANMNDQLPGDRKYLTNDEFNAVYGADKDELKKIELWAHSKHLKVVDSNPLKRRVLVEGSITDINAAFGIELNEYEHPSGTHFRGREGNVHVPEELSDIVTGVFGLDTRPLGKSRRRKSGLSSLPLVKLAPKQAAKTKGTSSVPGNPFPGTFYPPQVATLYNYPSNVDGTGQNIAVFAFNGLSTQEPRGGYSLTSLKTYFEQALGQKTPVFTDVVVQGRGNDPGPDTQASSNRGDSTGEIMLDLCVVGSVAYGAHVFVYFTEFTSKGWVDAIHDAISGPNQISVISISYGNPERDPSSAWTGMSVKLVNEAFEAAAAKGITICCASGDDGSGDGSRQSAEVDFPASSPNVLGVGGTKLVASSTNPGIIQTETVWNETLHQEGSTGGGVSELFTKPSYQDKAKIPPSVNPPHKIGRGVPDICAVGDPVTGVVVMHIDGKHIEPIGGTSASAPLWASLIARLNQGLNARCGFLNPILYQRLSTGVLHDIQQGNNGAYAAGKGWDACSGLGSPDGVKLLKGLSIKASKTKKKKK
jgi:kumamolisin